MNSVALKQLKHDLHQNGRTQCKVGVFISANNLNSDLDTS